MCKANDYTLDVAEESIHMFFEKQVSLKDENFANGRLVRNLYDDLVMNHARRMMNIAKPGAKELSAILPADFLVETSEGENRRYVFTNE